MRSVTDTTDPMKTASVLGSAAFTMAFALACPYPQTQEQARAVGDAPELQARKRESKVPNMGWSRDA